MGNMKSSSLRGALLMFRPATWHGLTNTGTIFLVNFFLTINSLSASIISFSSSWKYIHKVDSWLFQRPYRNLLPLATDISPETCFQGGIELWKFPVFLWNKWTVLLLLAISRSGLSSQLAVTISHYSSCRNFSSECCKINRSFCLSRGLFFPPLSLCGDQTRSYTLNAWTGNRISFNCVI